MFTSLVPLNMCFVSNSTTTITAIVASMERRKRNRKPTAFVIFVQEWRKRRAQTLEWEQCIHLAGPAWQKMTPEERQPYKDALRLLSQQLPKPTSNGTEEQRQRHMQNEIERLVRNSAQQEELEVQRYCFIMVNYFTKDVYSPAELAAAQFSLREGVQSVYHTLINPGIIVYGSLYESQEYVKATHQLPLPPNALGNQDFEAIQADLLKFVRSGNKDRSSPGELPPVFTLQKQLAACSSALKFLNGGLPSELNVYPIEHLFYIMKEATCKAGMLPPPESIHITNTQFNLDPHEFLSDIGCEFHAQRDLSKHCSKSIVTRWGFTFSSYMCSDLAIKMLSNSHMPGSGRSNGNQPNNNKQEDQHKDVSKETDEHTEVTQIKVESEEPYKSDALDTLNSLDLDNIFDDEDILGLDGTTFEDANFGENINSLAGESNVAQGCAEALKIISKNAVDLAPAPPKITHELKDDSAIFTRRPKRVSNDCERQKQELQPIDKSSVQKISFEHKDRSSVKGKINKIEYKEKKYIKTHLGPQSNTKLMERRQRKGSISSNKSIGYQRRLSSERGRSNRSHRSEIQSPKRMEHNRIRSRSRSAIRGSRFSPRDFSSRLRTEARSRTSSNNRNNSPCHRLSDRSRCKSISPKERHRYSSKLSPSPIRSAQRAKYDITDRRFQRDRVELTRFTERRRPVSPRQHSVSPLGRPPYTFSRNISRKSKQRSRSPRISHIIDLSQDTVSPQYSSQRYGVTSIEQRYDAKLEKGNHESRPIPTGLVHRNLALSNEAPRKSLPHIVGHAMPASATVTHPNSICPFVSVYDNRGGRNECPQQYPVQMQSHFSHTNYSTHQYRSTMTYESGLAPAPGTHYERQVHPNYGPPQHPVNPYDLRHRLGMTRVDYLPQNDLRHRIHGRSELGWTTSEMMTYPPEHNFAHHSPHCNNLPPYYNEYRNFLLNSNYTYY